MSIKSKRVKICLITGLFLVSMASSVKAVPIAGLDWLRFSNTLGLSWNDVQPMLEPGGSLEGWRYATRPEIGSLYTALHPGWVANTWSTANEGITDAVGSVLGYTTWQTNGFKMIDAIAWPSGGAFTVSNYRLVPSDRYAPPNTDYAGFGHAINKGSSTAYGRPVASYLVRIDGILCPELALLVFIQGSDPEIEIEVYDKDGNLRHLDRSDIHFGDRIVLKATGNPFPEGCEVTYKWYGEFPEGSKAELSPDNESQTSFTADKLGIYDVDLHVQSGNYIIGASVELIVNVMDLDLKFFSGDPKSEKKARSRIKGAKYGRYGYLGEAKSAAPKDEENGFDWWKEKIESNCFIKIEYHLLPDDIETMGEYNGYSTIESTKTDKQHDRWLIGSENALVLLGPPAQTFHLAVFRSDSLWYDDGDLVKKDHVIYDYSKDEASDLLMTRTKPYGYSQRMWIAEHEIGHLFGLTHPHGGIMSSDDDVFEDHEFFEWWCEDIIEHLNKFPVD